MGSPGDAALLRAARRDPQAFCEFYERHAVRLRAWLRRECASTEVATDLTAETFAQALVSLARFRGTEDAQAAAWLYAIARNLLAQYRRRQRVETAARRRVDLPIRDYGGFEESDEHLDAETMTPELHDALDGLPDGERAALTLRIVDQLSYDEIAHQLALATPAARMRVARALQTLRTRLSGAA